MYIAPIALAASIVLVAMGWFVSNQRAAQERERLAAEHAEREAQQFNKLMRELEEQNRAIQIAENEAALAKSDYERQMAMAKLEAAQAQQRRTQANIAAVRAAGGGNVRAGTPGAPAKAKPACTCQAGDPLCSCL